MYHPHKKSVSAQACSQPCHLYNLQYHKGLQGDLPAETKPTEKKLKLLHLLEGVKNE